MSRGRPRSEKAVAAPAGMGEHPRMIDEDLEAASVPPIDVVLVERLVAVQFPQWAGLPVVAASRRAGTTARFASEPT